MPGQLTSGGQGTWPQESKNEIKIYHYLSMGKDDPPGSTTLARHCSHDREHSLRLFGIMITLEMCVAVDDHPSSAGERIPSHPSLL